MRRLSHYANPGRGARTSILHECCLVGQTNAWMLFFWADFDPCLLIPLGSKTRRVMNNQHQVVGACGALDTRGKFKGRDALALFFAKIFTEPHAAAVPCNVQRFFDNSQQLRVLFQQRQRMELPFHGTTSQGCGAGEACKDAYQKQVFHRTSTRSFTANTISPRARVSCSACRRPRRRRLPPRHRTECSEW